MVEAEEIRALLRFMRNMRRVLVRQKDLHLKKEVEVEEAAVEEEEEEETF